MLPATLPPLRRDLRLDALRGLLVVSMAIAHTVDSPLRAWTAESLGYLGSAEGFVFLSGLVAGWVYGRRLLEHGFAAACGAAARRAGAVYRAHLLTFFGALVWTVLLVLYTHPASLALPAAFVREPQWSAVLGPLLLQQPPLLDILPMYCAFLLALPWIVRAVARGQAGLLLALSFATWAFAQGLPARWVAWEGRIDLGSFQPLTWQLLFVAGAVLGAQRAAGESPFRPRLGFVVLAATAAGLLFALRHGSLAAPWATGTAELLAAKSTLGPLRVANLALVAYVVAAVAHWLPRALVWRPFTLVGQSALACFAAQAFVAFALRSVPQYTEATATGRWGATAVMLAAVFGTALVRRRRHHQRIEQAIAQLLRTPAPKPPPESVLPAR